MDQIHAWLRWVIILLTKNKRGKQRLDEDLIVTRWDCRFR